MRLRTAFFLRSLAVAIPVAIAWYLVDGERRLFNKEEELRAAVATDITNGLQERCEADPPRTGRPGRGGLTPANTPPPGGSANDDRRARRRRRPRANGAYEYFAYDADGHPSSADAPPLPPDRDDDIEAYWSGTARGVAMVVSLGNGPCAFILARIPPRPNEVTGQLEALGIVLVVVFAASWFASGALIPRIRRLEQRVRDAASAHYANPIPADGADEISGLARAFNDAGAQVRSHVTELRQREETLRAFVAHTTHDVGVPLSVLQGHLADLDRLAGDQNATRDHVRAAIREAHYMGSLLRNLEVAATLDEAGAHQVVARTDLGDLVSRVVARHQPIARASDIELNVAVPDARLEIETDPVLFERALSNLVDNAVRYNRPGGHVAVMVEGSAGAFTVSVTDDGPGVPPAELSQLTERWFRGSTARTRRPDGKGLGLAIANESLARLGMTLTFRTPADGGLRAEIRSRPS